jgi:hypothetical protein
MQGTAHEEYRRSCLCKEQCASYNPGGQVPKEGHENNNVGKTSEKNRVGGTTHEL